MADSTAAGTRGVPPSPSVTTGVSAVTGRRSRYSAITPRHCAPAAFAATGCGGAFTPCPPLAFGEPQGAPARSRVFLPLDPHHAVNGPHRLPRGQVAPGPGHPGLSVPRRIYPLAGHIPPP